MRFLMALVLAAVTTLSVACGSTTTPTSALDDDAITIGSFDFPESELLAELYATALEREGFSVDRRFGVGPRELALPALQRGLVELLPEYGGSALNFATGEDAATADANVTHAALVEAMASRGRRPIVSACVGSATSRRTRIGCGSGGPPSAWNGPCASRAYEISTVSSSRGSSGWMRPVS